MINDARILIVDDDEDVIFSLKVLLDGVCDKIFSTTDPRDIPSIVRKESLDIVLLDMNFNKDAINGEEGFYWMNRIIELIPDLPIILITAYGDINKAIRAIQEGAYDFVTKPWQNEKMIATINAAVQFSRIEQKNTIHRTQRNMVSRQTQGEFDDLIGSSPQMQKVVTMIRTVASTEADVLITGENGTGKELVARAIHKLSHRASEVFLSVDMGAVNHQLFDSELFGHVKGAFTGAGVDRIGKLVAASGGTLFLDEIGNLSPELQTKLMKVLEERETCALGSNKSVKIDVRLVCATNRDLDEAVENGEFRQDLLFRINTIEINLPPLRERENDIPQLCSYFLNIFNCKYQKSIKGLSNAAHKQLSEYHFPGNVRELKHIIHRAVILCSGNVLAPEHLALRTKVKNRSISLASLNIEEAEEKLIREALAKYSGNMKRAAEALGINRTSLYRRLEKYGL